MTAPRFSQIFFHS